VYDYITQFYIIDTSYG